MILLTGASGRIAHRTAQLLAQAGQRLRFLTRSPEKAPRIPGSETVRGDFAESATLEGALVGIDTALIISASGEPGKRALLHRNAFHVARTTAAVLQRPLGGVYDVTGPAALSVTDIAARLSGLVGRHLRYEDEPVDAARERFSKNEPLPWRVDLSVGWFEAIAAGEQQSSSDTVLRFTGSEPLPLEEYSRAFPKLLDRLRT